MIEYGFPETTTAEYPATTPGIAYSTGYDVSSSYQYTLPQTEVQYQTTTAAVPQISYDYSNVVPAVDYQSVDLGYSNYQVASAPLATSYQQVSTIKHVPVTRIRQVPVVTTRYVPSTSLVGQQSVVSSQVPAIGGSIVAPQLGFAGAGVPLPLQGNDHFVSNYPIYENDPRRVAMGLSRSPYPGSPFNNLALAQSYSLGTGGLNTSGLRLGGLYGLNNSLGGVNSSGLNMGNTGLSSLNNLGSGLNSVKNLSSGLNNLTTGTGASTASTGGLDNLASTVNGLTEGLGSNSANNPNNLSDGINTLTDGIANTGVFADNLREGNETAIKGANAGLNNLANNLADASNNLATNTGAENLFK